VEVAAEKNSTLILPFPVELLRFLERSTPEREESTAEAGSETPELTAPKVPDYASGLTLNGPVANPRSEQNA